MSLPLRPTTAADLPRLIEWESALRTAAFLGEIGVAWHERALADPRQEHLVAERDGEPAAFAVLAGLWRAADQEDRLDPGDRAGRVLEIRRLVVAPERRGAGVGRALLRAVRDRAYLAHRADRVWLDVRPGNARARHLYASEGFVVTSRDVGADLLIMFHRGVRLVPLDEASLGRLLDAAVEGADPLDVMPPVAGAPGWTRQRRAAFVEFHRSRGLAAEPVESTYAVMVGDGEVVGAARLEPVAGQPRTLEAGLWLARAHRGVGVGGAALRELAALAREDGATALVAETTSDNAPMRRILAAGLGATLTQRADGAVAAHLSLGGSA
ncbi:GNAT family N-acetyltransferase [Streptomyces sp. PT12]|uniref:GNAT family N-acetyltransferase n=1 Tax=Streptomyces sp. PT12 TaxID=1510197 RepID=UPI000DE27E42|nr:GNAT family N-acetyltransferase [Streptomyces sp. PT12]RBM19058.1 hypothetical protein DEH69_11675 [Streptomyces sp. PT12]